jgi:amino acid transporter
VFKRMSVKHRTPVGAANLTALVSASITLIYGVLFSLTNGDIDALFWSLFAFSSIVFLLPYVAMSLAFLRLRHLDPHAHRPYTVPGGSVGAWLAAVLVIVLLVASVFFFMWNPWLEFDATTTWLILGGLAATFVAQEVLVARSRHWKAAAGHPELGADVELEGIAPDNAEHIDRAVQHHGGGA